MNVRVIGRLDIKPPNLVKGVHLEGLRVLGDPHALARLYYEEGIDEILYMDIVASLYQRNSLLPLVSATARDVFIPMTVGGGLRSLDDIQAVLRAGADKVSLNTAVIGNPNLIHQAARRFGSSTIVVSVEAKLQPDGSYEAYVDNGRERTGRDAVRWAAEACALGAGEILVTSIDREGTGRGFDIELTRRITAAVSVPVIACGGAGRPADAAAVVRDARCDAVAVASVLHYHYTRVHDAPHIDSASISMLKGALLVQGVPCRSV